MNISNIHYNTVNKRVMYLEQTEDCFRLINPLVFLLTITSNNTIFVTVMTVITLQGSVHTYMR